MPDAYDRAVSELDAEIARAHRLASQGDGLEPDHVALLDQSEAMLRDAHIDGSGDA